MSGVRVGIATLMLLVLAACGGTVETPGEPLRLLSERLPEAYLEEPYQATLRAVGGLRPFTYTHSDGALPPGLSISNGTITGTPTATDRFTFTITVSDASLNKTFQEYTITVSEVPAPTISYNAPETEIQRRVTLRVVADGRDLRALRTSASWDPEAFELVEGSLSHPGDLAVFSSSEPGSLQVHVAALGESMSGSRQMFSFDLEPVDGTPSLRLETETEFLARERHFFAQAVEGASARSTPSTEGDLDGDQPTNQDGDENDENDGGSPASGDDDDAETDAEGDAEPGGNDP